jgi:hypothetical protein
VDLKRYNKVELLGVLVYRQDRVRNQATRYANAMGADNEAIEKATYDQLSLEFTQVQEEILRRLP